MGEPLQPNHIRAVGYSTDSETPSVILHSPTVSWRP